MSFSEHMISLTGLNLLLAMLIAWLVVAKRWRSIDIVLLVAVLVSFAVFHKMPAEGSPDSPAAIGAMVESKLEHLQQNIFEHFELPYAKLKNELTALETKVDELQKLVKKISPNEQPPPPDPTPPTTGHPQAEITGALSSSRSPDRVNLVLKNSGEAPLVKVSGNVWFCEAETGPIKSGDCKLTRQNRKCQNDFICLGENLLIEAGKSGKERFVTIPSEYKRKESFRIYVELDYADQDGRTYSTRCTGNTPSRQSGQTSPFTAKELAIKCNPLDRKI